jgi:hypothetical protein
MWVRFVGPGNITMGCETLHMKIHIQNELPIVHGYMPKAHNYLVVLYYAWIP